MKVAIALFPRNTSLDAIGPYETLQRVPSIDVVFVGHRRGEVRSDNGMLGLMCDAAFDEVTELNREAALASQLMIEYDPVPPFDSGTSPRPPRRRSSWRSSSMSTASERFRSSPRLPLLWCGCRRRRPSCRGSTVAVDDHRR